MFANMKLGTKIYSLVMILLVIFAGVSGFSLFKINSIGVEIEEIAEVDIPLTTIITKVTVHQLEQAINFERAMRMGGLLAINENATETLKVAVKKFNELTISIEEEIQIGEEIARTGISHASTEEARKEFQFVEEHLVDIDKRHATYVKHVEEVFLLIENGKIEEADHKAEAIEVEEEKLDKDLEEFDEQVAKFTEESALRAETDEKQAMIIISIASAAGLLLGLLLSFMIVRSITRPIQKVIAGIAGGSEQVASASSQVSASSQIMAEGASEQAASIEETSSTL